jgi:transposase
MQKHFLINIQEDAIEFQRDVKRIEEESLLDGFYVIRSSILNRKIMSAEQLVASYKNLSKMETAFRCLKSIDLDIRPIYHRLPNRVRAHQ